MNTAMSKRVMMAAGAVLALVACTATAEPRVTNVSALQRPGTKLVDIVYDVSTTSTNPVTISITVSNTAGLVAASHFSGDIGSAVIPGTGRRIVWDGGADQEGHLLSDLRVWISAQDNGGSGTPLAAGMVSIPAGSFVMGSAEALPQHTVQLTSFTMDKTEVSKAKWDEVAAWAMTNGYDIAPNTAAGKGTAHPAQNMTWFNAVKWCNARSEREGLTPCYTNTDGTVYRTGSIACGCNWAASGYRLPTEAEWEYAARGGGTTNRFPWTDTDTIQHTRANYWSDPNTPYDTSDTRGYHPAYTNGGMPYTSPTASFAPNAYGLFDMAGNVFEWCWDWYSAKYPTSPTLNPHGVASGSARVVRGGSWGGSYPSAAYVCGVSYRNNSAPNGPINMLGFRCVKSIPQTSATPVPSGLFSVDFRYLAGIALSGLTPTYNGLPQAVSVSTTPSGLPVTLNYGGSSAAPVNAGTYTVTATIDTPNYTASTTATLVIAKALLTVTAEPKSRTYLQPNPPLTAVLTGFMNGETAAVVSGAPVLNTPASSVSSAGTYPIVVNAGTLSAANYAFGLVNGVLTVRKAPQVIAFDCLIPRTVKDPPIPLAASASSGLPVAFVSDAPSVATVTNTLAIIAGAGSATISAVQPGNENYLPAQAAQTLVVAPLVGFALWADQHGLCNDLVTEFALDRDGDGIPNGLEYALGTNWVAGTPLLTIRFVDGAPVVEVPKQDESTMLYVTVEVKCCTDLLCGDGWTVPTVTPNTTTSVPANREWHVAADAPATAFFKLEAALK